MGAPGVQAQRALIHRRRPALAASASRLYVVEATQSDRSVYRLYHAALAEYLRQGREEAAVHEAFAAFLIGHVSAVHGLDWGRAHPYTLAHLATHARRAGLLDDLLQDPGYLVNAIPAGLLAALPAARTPSGHRVGAAYRGRSTSSGISRSSSAPRT